MERFEARHLLKALKDDGWFLSASEEACRQYVHRSRPGIVTVSLRHTDELGPGTRASAEQPGVPEPGAGAEGSGAEGSGAEPRVVLEQTSTGYSAYTPDYPGCVATGGAEEETRKRLLQALALHRAGLASGR